MLRCLLTCGNRLFRYPRYVPSICDWQRTSFASRTHSSASAERLEGSVARETQDISNKNKKFTAARRLAYLVSQEYATSSSLKVRTPRDIKGFYRAVKAEGLFHELSSDELSSLIQLFGSLSLLEQPAYGLPASADTITDRFDIHPLAPVLYKHQTSGKRGHWAFVLQVARDKSTSGMPLGESDNYWLMRAALEDAKRVYEEGSKDVDMKTYLDRTRKHYIGLRPSNFKDEWSLHQLYLTAILDCGGREYCDEVIVRLGNLISWNGGLHSGLRAILWRALTFPGAIISSSTKARFLHTLRTKLARVPDILHREPHASDEVASNGLDDTQLLRLYDALAIRDYMVDIVFSFKPGTHRTFLHLREVYPWVLFECRAALCAFNDGTFATSEEENHAAWGNLVLLALSFAPAQRASGPESLQVIAPEQGLDGGLQSQSQVLGWTVICALAALSTELHVRSHVRKQAEPSSVPAIQEISRTLWFLWRKEEAWRAGAVARSMPLNCCATTSFMALASISGDSRLAVSLVQHISDSIIDPAQLGGEVLDRSMLMECAVHFAFLVATWGVRSPPQHSWKGILGALRYAQLIPDARSPSVSPWTVSIANTTLMSLSRVDPEVSHRLLQSAAEHGLTIQDDVVLEVGKALAFAGRPELAIVYLTNGLISGLHASHLLDALLLSTLHHRQDALRLDLVQSFEQIFRHSSTLPTNNTALENFIHACLHADYLEESMRIVRRICESSSTLLRPKFLAQIVTALVSHRRYKTLGKVLKDTWHMRPAHRALFRNSRLQFTDELLRRFPKSTGREVARSLPFSVYVWPVLRHHIPFHPRLAQLDKKIISLKLSNRLQKAEKLDEKTLDKAVHLLVGAGRITAALKLLSKHASTISTRAGNIILSASLQPRSSRKLRRQVRHASTRLAQLVQERGFVPDRVTLNLLMKALLRWQSITPKAALRTLFDRLTMSGYPLPDSVMNTLSRSNRSTPMSPKTAKRTVFASDISASTKSVVPVNLSAFSKHISFARHTRPLYKMFVKEFQARGDLEGAQRVANVLQKVEKDVKRERLVRDQARRMGRLNARWRLQNARPDK